MLITEHTTLRDREKVLLSCVTLKSMSHQEKQPPVSLAEQCGLKSQDRTCWPWLNSFWGGLDN